jgi:ribonucleoside-triphosphate reductase
MKTALSVAFNVLLHTSGETDKTQTFNYFNVFLAPFVKGIEIAKIRENLRLFVLNLNQHVDATLALELSIPKSTAEKEAIGPSGRDCGKYGDYAQEARLMASLLIDVFLEESLVKPLLSPKIVVKINSAVLQDDGAKDILLKAHRLAVQSGSIYFANTTKTENAAFCASGVKFSPDVTGDWETDTIRTGCLGSVTINLPRIIQECEKDKNKFLELLKERFELAARALTIKNNALKQFGKTALPFLLMKSSGDTYFRLENCSRIVNLAGFREAVEAFTQKSFTDQEGRTFSEEIINNLLAFKQKIGRKYGKRLYPALLGDREASERLAQLDVERFGVAKVKFSGSRDKPFYSMLRRTQIKVSQPLGVPAVMVEMARVMKGFTAGGSLDILELESAEFEPQALMDLSMQIVECNASEFFTYNRVVSYCDNCRKNYPGTLHKCPQCGSMSTLTTVDRFAST